MYAAALDKVSLLINLVPRSFRLIRDFMVVPDRLHRWSVAIVSLVILALAICFVAFAYAEKYHLADNFFYNKLQFSFVDGGYPEMFGYALEILGCVIFAMFAWMHEKKQWYAWSAILFVTFLDDAFRSHETIGQSFTVWFGVSPVEGDLIGFATTGLISAVLWFAGAVKIQNLDDFSAYLVFTGYYTLLILFGVGVDSLHGMFGAHMSQTVFTLFEDGGELVTTATICLSALGMLIREKHTAKKKLEEHAAFQQDLGSTATARKIF